MGHNGGENDVRIRRKRTSNFSVLQVHCPEVNSKAEVMENCRYTIAADLETIETIFRIIVSANQLSLYGAVALICEEYEFFHERTGQPVVRGQSSPSFVPSVIKTEVPLDCDDLALKDLLLQLNGERIEKLSQQDRLSKFCMDAGFLNVVEIGQYFMTKDTEEQSHNSQMQWIVVSTHCQEMKKHRNQKVRSEETPELDPYWKLQPVACTVSTELRSELCL